MHVANHGSRAFSKISPGYLSEWDRSGGPAAAWRCCQHHARGQVPQRPRRRGGLPIPGREERRSTEVQAIPVAYLCDKLGGQFVTRGCRRRGSG